MEDLLQKILINPSNQKVINFLKIDRKQQTLYLKKWVAGRNGPDEGGTELFDNYGIKVPAFCKYNLSIHTIMVHPNSGVIFAFNTGRFSMFFRCDFERSGLVNTDDYRRGYTFDCISDITMLGEDWAYLEKFREEVEEQLRWAYEKIMAK